MNRSHDGEDDQRNVGHPSCVTDLVVELFAARSCQTHDSARWPDRHCGPNGAALAGLVTADATITLSTTSTSAPRPLRSVISTSGLDLN